MNNSYKRVGEGKLEDEKRGGGEGKLEDEKDGGGDNIS